MKIRSNCTYFFKHRPVFIGLHVFWVETACVLHVPVYDCTLKTKQRAWRYLKTYLGDINCMALSIVYLLISLKFAFCWFSFICTSWVFLRLDIATYSWLFFFIWYLTVIIHTTFLGFAKFCRLLYLKTEQVQLFTVEQCNVSARNSYRITIRFSRLPLKIQLIPLPSKTLL